jgi:hypothetical protein
MTQEPKPSRAFVELLRLEGQRYLGPFLIAAGFIALVAIYAVRAETPSTDVGASVLFLVLAIPPMSLPLLAIYWGFSALGDEWRGHTHQLLLSLPVRGRTVLGAKLVAAAVGLGALALAGGGLAWWRLVPGRALEASGFGRNPRLLIEGVTSVSQAGLMLVWFVATLLMLFAAGLLAYAVGRVVRRLQGWTAAGSFVGLLGVWVLVPLEPVRQWFPSLGCRVGGPPDPCLFSPAEVLFDAVLIGLMWWVATTLWDRGVLEM